MAYDWLGAQWDVIEVDFQKVDIHTGDKWLIYDIKRHRDNQFQRLNPPVEYASWLSRCDIKGPGGTMLNSIFWKKVQWQKHPGRWGITERKMPSVTMLFKTNTSITVLVYLS